MAEGDPLASTYFKNISKGQWYDCGHKTHTESSLKKLRFGPPTRESDCSKTSSMKYRVGATKRSTITKSVEHPIKQDISPKHAYGQKGSNLLKRAAWIRETEHQTGNGRDSGGPTATEESRPSFSDSSPGLPTILPFHEPETEMAGEQLSPLEVAQFYLTSGAGGSPTLQRIPHVGVSTEDSDSESLLGSPVMFL
ncbi:hypothetical protein DFJ73DRAFT_273042 [Zopfochytrium polystomum]|nr:hypothetical protein DFJ73DRAFT_273042 [Zopfochytrium polystomum]